MSFFSKGDFKIEESWEKKPPSRSSNSRDKSRNTPLLNAGKNIIQDPNPDILDDEISKRILKDLASDMPPSTFFPSAKPEKKEASRIPPKQKAAQGEGDLLASMASRLKAVEMTCKSQREELKVLIYLHRRRWRHLKK